jgi:quercetin dioxygenase-like cupin family protein
MYAQRPPLGVAVAVCGQLRLGAVRPQQPGSAITIESAQYQGGALEIISSKDRTSLKGNEAWFTGVVWLDEIAVGAKPSRVRLLRVSFEPGARTAWHTHPLGQVLHVLAGVGLVQKDGEPVREIHPGDTVMIEPGARHWHGAAPGNTMVHLAMQEADDKGVAVTWFEKVTDQEYSAR